MDNKNRILSLISLSKKAGKLILGFDVAKKEIYKGTVDCIYVCCDLSEKTLKEVDYICENMDVEVRKLPISLDEMWYEVGKRSGVICITEFGLAKKVSELLDNAN
ncbi:MAG: ribosomal L7Ae/L30e/S12e/Gadd45 family protein [Oscillospiraceae bacterium]